MKGQFVATTNKRSGHKEVPMNKFGSDCPETFLFQSFFSEPLKHYLQAIVIFPQFSNVS